MSIVAYVGLPGHGKSYGVVENVILPALKADRHVITNIPLHLDKLQQHAPGAKLTQLEKTPSVGEWLEAPAGSVIVIDELYHWWPSGTTADKIPGPQKSFFAEHRHRVGLGGFSNEIVIVVQDLSMIAAFVRALVETTFRVEKLTAVGSTTRYRVDMFRGAVTGQAPSPKSYIKSEFGQYKPEVYECYQSHTQGTGAVGKEVKVDKRATVFGSWQIKATIAALCLLPLLIWGVIHSLTAFKNQVTGKNKLQPVITSTAVQAPQVAAAAPSVPHAAPVPPPAPAQPSKPAAPLYSAKWRIIGLAVKHDGSGFAMLRSATGWRRIHTNDCTHVGSDADMHCTVDGEVVTYFSGDTGGFASAAVAAGALTN